MYTKKGIIGGKVAKSIIIILFIMVSLSLVLNPASLAQTWGDTNDTMTLEVNISEQAAIEVLPTSIFWEDLSPGSNGTASVRNISIKNTGSTNLTNFYIDVNTGVIENESPIGTGNISYYAASGFMLFRNESTNLEYKHLGRLEWNLSEVMDTEVLNLGAGVVKYGHGWYKRADGNEYLWKVENGSAPTGNEVDAWCNRSDTTFTIKLNPENISSYNRDFTVATESSSSPDANNKLWSIFSFSDTRNPLHGQCVAVYYDCTRIYIYKYDMNATSDFNDCASAAYISTEVLVPGDTIDKLKIKPSIPQGTPAGNATASTLTIIASIPT